MGDAPATETIVDNYIAGQICKPVTNKYLPILNPSTSSQIGQVALSTSQDVNTAVAAAHSAFDSWSSLTVKARAAYMLKFHALVREHANELATLIVLENGKNITVNKRKGKCSKSAVQSRFRVLTCQSKVSNVSLKQ